MADHRRRLTAALLLISAGLAGGPAMAADPDEPTAAGATGNPSTAPAPPSSESPAMPMAPPPLEESPAAPNAAPTARPSTERLSTGQPSTESAPNPPPAAAQPPGTKPGEPAPTSPPAPSKGEAQPPKNLEPIPKETAISVLGHKVLGPSGEDMGRVVDLLLDHDGHLQAVVIDFGGFLGVGSRKIAIDWRLVRFVPDNRDAPLALGLGKAEVQAAPEYKDSAQPPVMVGPPPPPSDPDAAR
ncbi:MAG TPA: PRC-barrel domain-containing protein [Aliidongia sp.]|nr:PRC-barrel domain-containing protein [Aliidongia sp.]